MSRFPTVNVLRVLFVGLVVATASYAGGSPGKALDEQFLKAFNANDLTALMACYADDAVVYPPDLFMARGKEEVRKGMGDFLTKFKISDAKINNSQSLDMGSKSVTWGTIEFTATPTAGGDPMPMRARFTSIAEKRAGKWVYIVDHASMPLPPPPPAEKSQ